MLYLVFIEQYKSVKKSFLLTKSFTCFKTLEIEWQLEKVQYLIFNLLLGKSGTAYSRAISIHYPHLYVMFLLPFLYLFTGIYCDNLLHFLCNLLTTFGIGHLNV